MTSKSSTAWKQALRILLQTQQQPSSSTTATTAAAQSCVAAWLKSNTDVNPTLTSRVAVSILEANMTKNTHNNNNKNSNDRQQHQHQQNASASAKTLTNVLISCASSPVVPLDSACEIVDKILSSTSTSPPPSSSLTSQRQRLQLLAAVSRTPWRKNRMSNLSSSSSSSSSASAAAAVAENIFAALNQQNQNSTNNDDDDKNQQELSFTKNSAAALYSRALGPNYVFSSSSSRKKSKSFLQQLPVEYRDFLEKAKEFVRQQQQQDKNKNERADAVAVATLKAKFSALPEKRPLNLFLGGILVKTKQWEEALGFLESLSSASSSSSSSKNHQQQTIQSAIAGLYALRGDWEKSLQIVSERLSGVVSLETLKHIQKNTTLRDRNDNNDTTARKKIENLILKSANDASDELIRKSSSLSSDSSSQRDDDDSYNEMDIVQAGTAYALALTLSSSTSSSSSGLEVEEERIVDSSSIDDHKKKSNFSSWTRALSDFSFIVSSAALMMKDGGEAGRSENDKRDEKLINNNNNNNDNSNENNNDNSNVNNNDNSNENNNNSNNPLLQSQVDLVRHVLCHGPAKARQRVLHAAAAGGRVDILQLSLKLLSSSSSSSSLSSSSSFSSVTATRRRNKNNNNQTHFLPNREARRLISTISRDYKNASLLRHLREFWPSEYAARLALKSEARLYAMELKRRRGEINFYFGNKNNENFSLSSSSSSSSKNLLPVKLLATNFVQAFSMLKVLSPQSSSSTTNENNNAGNENSLEEKVFKILIAKRMPRVFSVAPPSVQREYRIAERVRREQSAVLRQLSWENENLSSSSSIVKLVEQFFRAQFSEKDYLKNLKKLNEKIVSSSSSSSSSSSFELDKSLWLATADELLRVPSAAPAIMKIIHNVFQLQQQQQQQQKRDNESEASPSAKQNFSQTAATGLLQILDEKFSLLQKQLKKKNNKNLTLTTQQKRQDELKPLGQVIVKLFNSIPRADTDYSSSSSSSASLFSPRQLELLVCISPTSPALTPITRRADILRSVATRAIEKSNTTAEFAPTVSALQPGWVGDARDALDLISSSSSSSSQFFDTNHQQQKQEEEIHRIQNKKRVTLWMLQQSEPCRAFVAQEVRRVLDERRRRRLPFTAPQTVRAELWLQLCQLFDDAAVGEQFVATCAKLLLSPQTSSSNSFSNFSSVASLISTNTAAVDFCIEKALMPSLEVGGVIADKLAQGEDDRDGDRDGEQKKENHINNNAALTTFFMGHALHVEDVAVRMKLMRAFCGSRDELRRRVEMLATAEGLI